jgi:hypothetical protein
VVAQPLPEPLPGGIEQVYTPDEPGQALKTGKVVRAVRLATPPEIDGRLDDGIWELAPATDGFSQRDPDNGDAATEITRLQVAYDDRYLYVAVACLDSSAAQIAAGLGRRDQFPSTDYVGIGFDTRHDHLNAYQFETNPSGVQRDFRLHNDDQFDFDYNAVWEVRTEMTEAGWTAEFRIPLSQMRFNALPGPGQVWGLNARRSIRRKGELVTWVPKPRGEQGEVSLFGHLVFEDELAPPRRLEVLPYLLTRGEQAAGEDGAMSAAAGVDLRVGLGPNATLAATVNPDFAQVEQDPAVLNLSVFETFFPEQRPFFLEDSNVFVPPYGIFRLFHSRRIGRPPGRLPLAAGDQEIERPDETTILGAVKVTGERAGWTYGGLTALTGREYATVTAGALGADRLVEPATSYNVVRLQREVLGDSSTIGVLATGVVRERADNAYTGGMDYTLRWDDNRVEWNGHWAVTRAPGPEGMKTSGGGVTNVNVARKHWWVNGHADHFGRDFRVTDLGFFRSRTDRTQVNGTIGAEQPDPGRWLRRYNAYTYGGVAWNDDRLVFDRYAGAASSMTFLNFWGLNGGVTRSFEVLNDIDTRGGPPILDPAATTWFVNANTDSRRSWRVNLGGTLVRFAEGGQQFSGYTNVTLQPSGRLQVAVASNYTQGTQAAQWVRNVDADADGTIDHVYGTLHQDVLDFTVRGTYAINRDLTFQAYLQPFVAVGDYDNLRRLARPRSFEFTPVSLAGNPDFNVKSLRGNLVLRWEYVRGSTLFVVWDLSQADTTRPGAFSPWRDIGDAFGADANHVVMVKVSYWLNR